MLLAIDKVIILPEFAAIVARLSPPSAPLAISVRREIRSK